MIKKIVEKLIDNQIHQSSFENLLDPHIQTLKEYYGDNFSKPDKKGVRSIFIRGRIGPSFVNKFLNMNPVSLKKMFSNAGINYVDIYKLTKQIEAINMNSEIQKSIIYYIIMNNEMNAHVIGRKTVICIIPFYIVN